MGGKGQKIVVLGYMSNLCHCEMDHMLMTQKLMFEGRVLTFLNRLMRFSSDDQTQWILPVYNIKSYS